MYYEGWSILLQIHLKKKLYSLEATVTHTRTLIWIIKPRYRLDQSTVVMAGWTGPVCYTVTTPALHCGVIWTNNTDQHHNNTTTAEIFLHLLRFGSTCEMLATLASCSAWLTLMLLTVACVSPQHCCWWRLPRRVVACWRCPKVSPDLSVGHF